MPEEERVTKSLILGESLRQPGVPVSPARNAGGRGFKSHRPHFFNP